MDDNIRRQIIIDHYQNPINKGLVDDENNEYIKNNTSSASCIDNIDIMYKIKDGVIEDIYFDGEACAISTAATSMMIKLLKNKTLDEARRYILNYEAMINEEKYDAQLMDELIVYNKIYLQPNRKKCALLPFESLKKAVEEYDEKIKG